MKPNFLQKKYFQLVDNHFCKISKGHLRLELPDGQVKEYGDSSAAVPVKVKSWWFFRKLVVGGSTGLGDAWLKSLWESEDLTAVIALFIDNLSHFNYKSINPGFLRRIAGKIGLLLKRNTRPGSRKNIHDHYDLGNDFYSAFLDHKHMMYSCALFDRPDELLADAQQRKIERIIELAGIKKEHHVLEIGCGWGGFAIAAARATGCQVTGLTISQEQYEFARQRVHDEQLDDRVNILMCDYRDAQGMYDRIVSIEMLEAVGHEYFGNFFEACDRLLESGGRIVLQSITIPDQRYELYRRTPDWIQKHIFPGGVLPSLTELCAAMTRSSSLTVDHLDNIGTHYAETLRRWRISFKNQLAVVSKLGYDEHFQRKWLYYLSSCEAAFQKRYIYDIQMVLNRPME